MSANQEVQRTGNPFGSEPIVAAPTSSSAAALVQREVAEVQSAMVIAQRFPRDPKASVDRILTACTRQGLAEVAVYEYSRGGQNVTGPSIRLAEELARQWGNMACGVTELHRGAGVSEAMAWAVDLETNYRDEKRFQVRHWRDTKKGGYAITDERDIYENLANMGARRKRACILAVIPGDVQEAAIKQCELTLRTNEEVTTERVQKMIEAFGQYSVTKAMLEARIQRRMDAVSPALLVQLRNIYNSLKDGMSRPEDWFDVGEDGGNGQTEPEPRTRAEAVKQRLRARKPEPKEAVQAEPDAPEESKGTDPEDAPEPDEQQPATKAAPTPPPPVPPKPGTYTEASAIAALRKAKTNGTLTKLWKTIRVYFRESEQELPFAVEVAYEEMAEHLEQQEMEL